MTDWSIKTLGDVCEVIAGQSPEGKFYNKEGRGVPFYQGKKDFAERFLGSPTTWTTEITKLARPGDILMSVRAPVGPVNLCPIEACIGRGLAAIRPSSKTGTDFIYYFLESIQSEIAGTEGAVFASINKAQIANLRCPVPPLEEQKRIVELLDAATARVTELTMCYEKARTHANNLYTSALRDALESNPDWPMGTLGSIFRVCSSKRVLKSEWRQTGVPFYRGREITLLSKYGIVDNELFISEDHFSELVQKYGVPKLGDIMITAIGTIGNSYVVKESDQFYFKDASVIWLDKHADIMSGYVQYWIGSSKFRDQLNTGNGATVDTLTIDSLSKMQISMPPLEEQKQIIARLDSMKAKTSEMVAAYDAKLTAAKNLRQSILEAAFAGDL